MAKKTVPTKAEEKQRPLTKNQIIANISEKSGLSKKDVGHVLELLGGEIEASFAKKGPGVFVLPGLVKIDKKQVKAQPAKKGVKSPLTGETCDRPLSKTAARKLASRTAQRLSMGTRARFGK